MVPTAVHALQAYAAQCLAPIADRSGRVLYSAAATLQPAPLYLLGLNPGGDPARQTETVGDALRALPDRTANAYLDESWKGCEPGQAPIQRRVHWLLHELGCETQQVCASNLIFVRSRSASGCGYPVTADLCWPVHEAILRIVQPRLILAFGNSGVSPFGYLHSRFRPERVEAVAAGHGNWRCLGFTLPNETRVVGVPHLSRYAIDRYPHAAAWIRDYTRI